MPKNRTIEDIDEEIEKQRDSHEKAALKANDEREKLENLIDEKTAARTASYDPELVQRARDISINPDNFEDEAILKDAVEKQELEAGNK